ncbi:MAG: hypothetical protein ACQGVC_00180 [Myxococcota bacterium]
MARLLVFALAVLALWAPAFGCSSGGGSSGSSSSGGGGGGGGGGSTPLILPSQGDWVDRGSTGIEASGVMGDWDFRIDGAISPVDVVKRGGVYYLYYIGADGNRTGSSGPRHRALGVATSTNGTDFVPHTSNPIVENLPNNGEEEGVFSGAIYIDDGGQTVLYYSAMDETSSTTVSADARRSTSSNGISFAPVPGPIVLDHDDSSVWNSGDELYPIGVFRDGSTVNLYYSSQGSVTDWGLGMATGSSSNFTSSQSLIIPSNSDDEIIGGGAVIQDTADTFLLWTLRDFSERVLEVREVPTADPSDIGNPIQSYTAFPNVQHFTVLLDEDAGLWFLYIAELSFIKVYTADVMRM